MGGILEEYFENARFIKNTAIFLRVINRKFSFDLGVISDYLLGYLFCVKLDTLQKMWRGRQITDKSSDR